MSPVKLLPGALSEITASVTETRALTKADRYGLMAAVLDESLEKEELRSIDRLLYSIRRGRVRLVDEI
ncbi:MAG: hypothetical protein P5702_07960 [Limnospira sp. PMC 1291.21]|uniref:Uncharacterized protein n=2 Tax=Limnospira TaxID=2596745 RepID=A0A9P1KBJ9_9CYAN|nr:MULTISPECIES: hypothetical protein [Limnospira]EKD10586.1 hypothetical protein SPLC1_S082610 [Arthrospira platensis C1]MBD2669850.1 hypothetical protein [Arthrospira platensis FACHB-439]MDY7053107.1 hypothetical protein [Limnospira fusiformis LS22]QJB28366.1 hypothetical protein HFV01_24415 [Limnospira fusiformis SAG 85.79]MDT9177363.1 hypothetical protein [Limnospira sp. PMC 1238.20]